MSREGGMETCGDSVHLALMGVAFYVNDARLGWHCGQVRRDAVMVFPCCPCFLGRIKARQRPTRTVETASNLAKLTLHTRPCASKNMQR